MPAANTNPAIDCLLDAGARYAWLKSEGAVAKPCTTQSGAAVLANPAPTTTFGCSTTTRRVRSCKMDGHGVKPHDRSIVAACEREVSTPVSMETMVVTLAIALTHTQPLWMN